MKNYNSMTVGQIVADSFDNAKVFGKYDIDFCCNGSVSLFEACRQAGVSMPQVIRDLEEVTPTISAIVNFNNWPLDLLIDYILKFHHRNIRSQGPEILHLLNKVTQVHGVNHSSLYKVQQLFHSSLLDLSDHLAKEETVLFPYIYKLFEAKENQMSVPDFHCGTIKSPIAVMMIEHNAEGVRFHEISQMTNGYAAPTGACNSYRLVLEKLKAFEAALHHHIHLENNIVFPRAILLESELRR